MGKKCSPEILLKLSNDSEARTLSSTVLPFSRFSLRWDIRDAKAESWYSASGSVGSAELIHATVIKHASTKSEFWDLKHLEMASKNDFCPQPRRAADRFLNHSAESFSSPSSLSPSPSFFKSKEIQNLDNEWCQETEIRNKIVVTFFKCSLEEVNSQQHRNHTQMKSWNKSWNYKQQQKKKESYKVGLKPLPWLEPNQIDH